MMANDEQHRPKFGLSGSRGFGAWLASTGGSIALSTYQAGKLMMLGSEPDGAVSLFERDFQRSMGIALHPNGRSLVLATQHQIYRFSDMQPGDGNNHFDAVFRPNVGWITGSVDAHDVAFGLDDRPIFVNTLYSCIASVSETCSFVPLWRPPFVTALAPEDRCHLNGLATLGGEPKFATAVSTSNEAEGWRNHRSDGGVLIDIASGEIAVAGLSMPHSPRFHDGRLWVLNSGRGEIGYADLSTGRLESVAFCPGYARGLGFAGHHAIIGVSRPRDGQSFTGLPLDEILARRREKAKCGLLIIDTHSGEVAEWVEIHGEIQELYDVCFIPEIQRPSIVGFKTDEIKKRVSIGASHIFDH